MITLEGKLKLSLLLVLMSICAVSLVAQNPSTPTTILNKIDSLIEVKVNAWCDSAGISYPPDASLLRIFKLERKIEIWSKNTDMKEMKLIKTLPICSMDFEPGPKFCVNDGKTPEGFYSPDFLYGSDRSFMWIKLDEDKVDDYGQVNNGSSFRMCLDYPNRLDRQKASAINRNPGSAICIHGNCVTAGCPSFTNWDFLPVFAFSRHHNSNQFGKIQVHIFPFEFKSLEAIKQKAEEYADGSEFTANQLYWFWSNLKEGYDLFNQTKNPLNINPEVFIFKLGDESPEILELKKQLINLSIYNGELNNVYDLTFQSAVKAFQRQHNLSPDGIIGSRTLSKLNYVTGKYRFIE